MFLILFVLNNPDLLDAVLTAWEEAGVSGATVLPSTGLGRIRQKSGIREDVPLMPALEDFYRPTADVNYTIFSVVESEALVQNVLQATEQAAGDLRQPRNGILVVLPVAQAYGLIPYHQSDAP
jgi:nitrogen regulatory protein PII